MTHPRDHLRKIMERFSFFFVDPQYWVELVNIAILYNKRCGGWLGWSVDGGSQVVFPARMDRGDTVEGYLRCAYFIVTQCIIVNDNN